jgi:hypothetical protein
MSNLVPTPTVDVNGKQTTVHKRAAEAPAANNRVRSVATPATIKKTKREPVAPPVEKFTRAEFTTLAQKLNVGNEQSWAVRNEAVSAFEEGTTNMYSHHYDAMWERPAVNVLGGQDGWTESDVRGFIAGVKATRDLVESGELAADDLMQTNVPADKETALSWCDWVDDQLTEALDTHGRSLVVNAKGAIERYQDFEGGRNRS